MDQRILEESRQHAIVLNQAISGSADRPGRGIRYLGHYGLHLPRSCNDTGPRFVYWRCCGVRIHRSNGIARRGGLIKIIIVVALVKSVQAAIAYQKG